MHELERIKECRGDRHAAVTDRLALLQGSEREGLAFQDHVPGGQLERLDEPAAGVGEHQAECSHLGALISVGGRYEAVALVPGEVLAFAGRRVNPHPDTEQFVWRTVRNIPGSGPLRNAESAARGAKK